MNRAIRSIGAMISASGRSPATPDLIVPPPLSRKARAHSRHGDFRPM
jgi:hypothetical protein